MADELRKGALLRNGTYRIERKLGQGGFGITYLARDLTLDILVAVKEFFPKDYCGREDTTSRVTTSGGNAKEIFARYKEKFIKEARNIAKLKHPRIIKIICAFEENDTAYYVMEYLDGMSLADMVKDHGPLSVSRALKYVREVGEALGYVHARSMTHLDVKPANIMVCREDDSPVLIDFGLAKQYDAAGQQTSTTPAGISHGYAPLEQYMAGGVSRFSPQTDIYSLAATLYFLLSGETPRQAPELAQTELRFPASIPEQFRSAITAAMASNPTQRYPSVAAFLAALTPTQPNPQSKPQPTPQRDDHTVIDDPKPAPALPRPVPPRPIHRPVSEQQIDIQNPPKKMTSSMILLCVGVLLSVLGLGSFGYFLLTKNSSPIEEPIGIEEPESVVVDTLDIYTDYDWSAACKYLDDNRTWERERMDTAFNGCLSGLFDDLNTFNVDSLKGKWADKLKGSRRFGEILDAYNKGFSPYSYDGCTTFTEITQTKGINRSQYYTWVSASENQKKQVFREIRGLDKKPSSTKNKPAKKKEKDTPSWNEKGHHSPEGWKKAPGTDRPKKSKTPKQEITEIN